LQNGQSRLPSGFIFSEETAISAITYFISDLHLDPRQPRQIDNLKQFLQGAALEAEALYILGDFFEVWVGDDDLTPVHLDIMAALQAYTAQGIPTYFMHGNRDFLVGKRFARSTGVTLLPDPTIIECYGRRILLMHGDSLCTRDIQHQRSRRTMHNKLYQKAVLCLPLWYRRRKAQQIREASRARHHTLTKEIMDVTAAEVERVIAEANADILIHGHTHRPVIERFGVAGREVMRVVLGAWHEQCLIACLTAQGECELVDVAGVRISEKIQDC